jgi:hypothetical protein
LARGCSLQSAIAAATKFHLDDTFPLSADKKSSVAARFQTYWQTYSHQDLTVSLGQPHYNIRFDNDNDPIESWEPEPLVEQGFSYELLNDRDYLFVLEGRIDLIGTISNQLIWMDHKFQGRRHDLYKKNIQFRNYSLATNLTMGIVNYIRLHKEVTKDTLQRDIVSFGPRERMLWREELIEIYKHIAADRAYARKNRGACAGRFGIPCEFTKICEESELVTIEAVKNTYYKKREEWKPW